MNQITISVVRVPGAVVEVVLNEGATVQDALRAATIEPNDNESIAVNGAPQNREFVLSDRSRVHVSQGAKGA